MRSPLLSTSHVTLWEEKSRLKCDYKQEEEDIKGDEIMMMKSVTDDEFEFNESHLLNFSIHFLEMIMENCAGVEYLKLRATCKRCHLAAPLMIMEGQIWIKEIAESFISFTMANVLYENYTGIHLWKEGILFKVWLVVAVSYQVYTGVRKLPCIEYSIADSFSFSTPPTSPDCMVVGFSGYVDWEVHIHFVGGAKHYLTKQDDQHLLLVNVSGESVEVFKLNDSTKTWEKVDDLGRHMIYISEETCLCVEAKTPEMGNKIYFPDELHNRNGRIVFYTLETCTLGTFNNKTIQVSHTVRRQLHHPCTWIGPCWS
uniref:uncharacterized protein LOC122610687 n=1 Tax=Erigeron canadensis TaxID=72917 RepID=UPI001CB91604|nr:uncharacterized protein LOC122610687 [Erigeron canadensis]